MTDYNRKHVLACYVVSDTTSSILKRTQTTAAGASLTSANETGMAN